MKNLDSIYYNDFSEVYSSPLSNNYVYNICRLLYVNFHFCRPTVVIDTDRFTVPFVSLVEVKVFNRVISN